MGSVIEFVHFVNIEKVETGDERLVTYKYLNITDDLMKTRREYRSKMRKREK